MKVLKNISMEEAERLFNSSMIDDHDNTARIIDGIVFLNDGRVCEYFKNSAFSLNPIYIGDDNKYHLDTSSIGGCVIRNIDIAKRIDSYNESIICGPKIVMIMENRFKEGV